MSSPPIRALVVDDEVLARRRLLALLAEVPDVTVIGEADSGSAAVPAIVDRRPDLVFLDVQMPGLDGFGVLRCVAGAHRPAIVFVTAFDEHAIRAFEVQAVDYLLKPVSLPRLKEAVRRAVARIRAGTGVEQARAIDALLQRAVEPAGAEARIPVRLEGRTVLLDLDAIDWVEADGDRLSIHVGRTVHSVRGTMAEFGTRLPAERFARIHRSVIVSLGRVREIESIPKGDYVLVLRDGTRLRTGRAYRGVVQALVRP